MLVLLEDVGVLARIPARAVHAVFLDQVGALAEPPVVFRVVAAGFGDVLAQRKKHLVADDLLVVDLGALGDGAMDQRIGILSRSTCTPGTRPDD